MPAPVVIIPDGLATDDRGNTIAAPSVAFRRVLDHVVEHLADHPVYVGPANAFGGPAYEQEVAATYLRERGIGDPIAPASPPARHVDTRGNASVLREYLQERGEWPLAPVILAVSALHARRGVLCFRREGYAIERVEAVPFAHDPNEPIVPRLFHYRHRPLHQAYEILAWVRDFVRP